MRLKIPVNQLIVRRLQKFSWCFNELISNHMHMRSSEFSTYKISELVRKVLMFSDLLKMTIARCHSPTRKEKLPFSSIGLCLKVVKMQRDTSDDGNEQEH